jgi:hypothetical protein
MRVESLGMYTDGKVGVQGQVVSGRAQLLRCDPLAVHEVVRDRIFGEQLVKWLRSTNDVSPPVSFNGRSKLTVRHEFWMLTNKETELVATSRGDLNKGLGHRFEDLSTESRNLFVLDDRTCARRANAVRKSVEFMSSRAALDCSSSGSDSGSM